MGSVPPFASTLTRQRILRAVTGNPRAILPYCDLSTLNRTQRRRVPSNPLDSSLDFRTFPETVAWTIRFPRNGDPDRVTIILFDT